MKHGKKYVDSAKLIDRSKFYDTNEALELCVKTSTAKFDETVEVHVKLGVDSRHADQQVRGAIVLPNGTGKSVRVLAICKGDAAKDAEAAGAEFVGAEEMVQKIQSENWMDFDVLITTPDITREIGKAIADAKAGKIEYRLDKTNIIHCVIGKVSFGAQKLEENFDALIGAIIKAKPAAAKGQYIRSCVVATTMGPGVKMNPNKVGAGA